MSERANHTYTQLLIVYVLSFEMKDSSWWAFLGVLMVCGTLAIAFATITEKVKGE